ncbi:MICOS complex subunit MIC60 [Sphingomonas sp. AP4-R1]|uniref:MICOS complex subunit MIC60 n=1 Tax=Sphingomonas sp. AP4-R1 TaxID=2735134 RepID=UPI0020A376B8|nr:MICOS complex subunit MIC60 [Sphingomonas sp. AP4-R1]
MWTPLLAILLAFAGGGVAMGYAVHNWSKLALLVKPALPVPVPPKPIRTTPLFVAPPNAVTDPAIIQRVDALDARVEAIDSQAREASGNADRAEALLVAFAARRVIDRGQPLGYLETMLRNHFGGVEPQAVAMTIASSQRPVTLASLQDGFVALSPSLVARPPQESWWKGFSREMSALFVIRRADTPSALPDDRRDRARLALEQGQVELALTEVARLPGAAAAKDWMASARRYVLVHNALDRIETAALLAPPPVPAPAARVAEPVAAPAPVVQQKP